jgi:hypothetical protein
LKAYIATVTRESRDEAREGRSRLRNDILGNEKRKKPNAEKELDIGGFNVGFLACTPALYQCTKSCFCVLLQAFESVVLDTQRKVKNSKLQNREALFLFLLVPHCSHVCYLSLPYFLKQEGFVSFQLTLYLHLPIFLLFYQPTCPAQGTENHQTECRRTSFIPDLVNGDWFAPSLPFGELVRSSNISVMPLATPGFRIVGSLSSSIQLVSQVFQAPELRLDWLKRTHLTSLIDCGASGEV